MHSCRKQLTGFNGSTMLQCYNRVDPKVAGYDKLATIKFEPGNFIMTHLQEVRGI